jgi:hypothetical protein
LADEDPGSRDDTVPPRLKWFVRAFLAAFIVCGLAGIEAWPLTGFRLFSHLRHEQVVGWERTAVDAQGLERAINFGGLPSGYRSFVLVVTSFRSKPEDERDAMCRAWMEGLRRLDHMAVAMRIYELDQSLGPRSDGRPTSAPHRTLLVTCSDEGASPGTGA